MGMCLRAKFEVSRIILTGFRQGVGNFTPPPQNEPLKSPPRLGLSEVTLYFRCAQFNRLLYHTLTALLYLILADLKRGCFKR